MAPLYSTLIPDSMKMRLLRAERSTESPKTQGIRAWWEVEEKSLKLEIPGAAKRLATRHPCLDPQDSARRRTLGAPPGHEKAGRSIRSAREWCEVEASVEPASERLSPARPGAGPNDR
ncbi:hypothetical protein Agsp01_25090 [Agromyces sp. NBRC 114283]|nr:hypothetical protein Agsp01_25090 [Agromyces sp. NBRC 114283]